jgi:signal recognition particle receptor subunit beta
MGSLFYEKTSSFIFPPITMMLLNWLRYWLARRFTPHCTETKESSFKVVLYGHTGAGQATILDLICRKIEGGKSASQSRIVWITKLKEDLMEEVAYLPFELLELLMSNYYDWVLRLYEGVKACCWVVNSDEPHVERIKNTCEECWSTLRELPPRTPLLIFANKQDSPYALSLEVIADLFGLHNKEASNHPWRLQGCSAIRDVGVRQGMDWLLKGTPTTKATFVRCIALYDQQRATLVKNENSAAVVVDTCEQLPMDLINCIVNYLPCGDIAYC